MHKRIANNTSFVLREKAWGTRQHYDRATPQLPYKALRVCVLTRKRKNETISKKKERTFLKYVLSS